MVLLVDHFCYALKLFNMSTDFRVKVNKDFPSHTPHNNCQSFYCCCTNIILNHTIKLNIVKSHAVSFTRINYLLPQTVISNPSSRCHHWKAVKILFGKIYDSVFLLFCPLLFLLWIWPPKSSELQAVCCIVSNVVDILHGCWAEDVHLGCGDFGTTWGPLFRCLWAHSLLGWLGTVGSWFPGGLWRKYVV